MQDLSLSTPFEGLARLLYSKYKKDRNYHYDEETIEIMRRRLKRTSNCIDIGAHRGVLLKNMVHFAPEGRHMAFEPIPELYQYLSRKFPGVQVFNQALSDTNGKVMFNRVVNAVGWDSGNIEQSDGEGLKAEIRGLEVTTNRLDDIFPIEQKLDFVKIDVEGAEYLVLKGAANTIERNKPLIVFEFGLLAAQYYGTKPEDIYRLFDKCDMHISLLHDFLEGGKALSLDDFNKQYFHELNYYFVAYS